MSRHRFVRNLDLHDELDDGDYDEHDPFEGITPDQQAQLDSAVRAQQHPDNIYVYLPYSLSPSLYRMQLWSPLPLLPLQKYLIQPLLSTPLSLPMPLSTMSLKNSPRTHFLVLSITGISNST